MLCGANLDEKLVSAFRLNHHFIGALRYISLLSTLIDLLIFPRCNGDFKIKLLARKCSPNDRGEDSLFVPIKRGIVAASILWVRADAADQKNHTIIGLRIKREGSSQSPSITQMSDARESTALHQTIAALRAADVEEMLVAEAPFVEQLMRVAKFAGAAVRVCRIKPQAAARRRLGRCASASALISRAPQRTGGTRLAAQTRCRCCR